MHTRLLARAASALITIVVLATCQASAAHAANATGGISALTPVVKTTAKFCPVGSTSKDQTLCGLGIRVSGVNHYGAFVSCLSCGPGTWGAWSKTGGAWVAKGTRPIAARASVLLVVTKPGYVGRYRLYRPADVDTPHAGLKLASQGCIGANISAGEIYKSFRRSLRKLPTVPCKPPKVTANVFTAGLNELSASTTSHALIYGDVSKPMWLTIAQTAARTCAPDPLGFSQSQLNSKIWYVWHVKGQFEEGLQTDALLPVGRFCIYLQTGSLYQGFPDGWTAQWVYNDYATGDVLTGTASAGLAAAGPTTVTLSGVAPRAEALESYDLLSPCPEYTESAKSAAFGSSTMQVSGAFSETLTTASFSQSGYVCSYLNNGGETVAMATDQVTVAGTDFKVQSDYPETADQAVTPVSDPIGDAGTTGSGIAAGQTVDVRCLVNGFGLAPFNPVWYEVTSEPWGDAFYAPAYAFYNNGQTSGTASKNPDWDAKVPFCNGLGVA